MADQPPFPFVANLDAAKVAFAQKIGKIVQGFGPEEVALLLSSVHSQPAPAPEVRDLFEIVSDPVNIPATVFRGAPAKEVAPYDVPYIEGREGVSNLQDRLYERLLESGGGLLVQSRAGVGKTREVAELAKRLCDDEGWTVCIAKGEGDARIDAPAAFPDDLRARRLLFVIDDLHRRVGAGVPGQAPYPGRLHCFLEFFAKSMAPGELYVIATARSEPHHKRQLSFDPSNPLWSRFKVYDLPEFTLSALQSALLRIAEAEGVVLDEADAQQMVVNSDRTLKTILDNVTRARRRNERLTKTNWSPSQGKSWELRFREAASRWSGVDIVYHALHLLREAGLPTRFAYVVGVGSRIRAADVITGAEGLVDMGLLGLRGEILDAFADEQLRDSLQNSGAGLPQLSDHWPCVIEATVAEAKEHPGWSQDLLFLTATLLMNHRFIDAELTLATAIACGRDDVAVYFGRGAARAVQAKWAGAEEDYSKAIDRGQDDSPPYFFRGIARWRQAKWAGAEEDFSKAMERGQDDALVYLGRGVARVLQRKAAQAEEDLGNAIERGQDDAAAYFLRGVARVVQLKWGGAEEDISKAIERGQDDVVVYFIRGTARVLQAKWAEAEEDLSTGIDRGRDDALDYYFRGTARGKQAKWTEAEQDLSKAMERGQDDAAAYFSRGLARVAQLKWGGADEDLNRAMQRGQDDASVYLARGLMRVAQKKSAEAEEDLSKAIECGRNDAPVYFARGLARGAQEKPAGAEEDLSEAVERGQDDATVYYRRGIARGVLKKWAGAEEDLSKAVHRGQDDAVVYFVRGIARWRQAKWAGAEEDFSKAMERGQDDALVYLGRGVARVLQRKAAQAEEDLGKAIERGQEGADVHLARAFVRVQLGRVGEAQEDCEQAEQRAPGTLPTHCCWGYLHLARREYDAAIFRYEAALKLEPQPDRYFELGLALLLRGRFSEAEDAYGRGWMEASVAEVKVALQDINNWSVRHPDRVESSEAKETIANIRQQLEMARKTDRLNG